MSDQPAPDSYPASLSPSRASDFTTCPLLYRFRSIDQIPEPPAPAAVRGTLVHRALETLFDLPAEDRHPQNAVDLTRAAFAELATADPASADAVRGPDGAEPDLAPYVHAYFALEDPRRLEPHAREVPIEVELAPGFAIRGYIDRVDRTDDGRVRIVDYKTGKAPSPRFSDKAMFQMRFYGLAWWKRHGTVPTRLQLLYLGDGRVLRHEPDENELKATEVRVLALRDSISAAAESGAFEPTPSRLCDWCSYQALCPAKGGTLPILPPRDTWPQAMRGGGSRADDQA